MHRQILDSNQFDITIQRLCFQLIENHGDFSSSVLIGIQPRGAFLAERIVSRLQQIIQKPVTYGNMDVTFYRDDFGRREMLAPSPNTMDFIVENKKVVLIDDVLYTGRTIRAALDALLDFGRPQKVELLTFIDRRFSRQLPIASDYVGMEVDTISTEKVIVHWKETDGLDSVELISTSPAEN